MNQRDSNNYDFDNNFTEEKFMNKIQLNPVNNLKNILNPNMHYEEQEKENTNISTENMTKTNSILSLQKKSTHSLPDRPEKNDNIFINNNFSNNLNLNNYKINQNQDFTQINKISNVPNINNNNNNQDDEYNRQKRLLMNELHNWSNFDEESNEDD